MATPNRSPTQSELDDRVHDTTHYPAKAHRTTEVDSDGVSFGTIDNPKHNHATDEAGRASHIAVFGDTVVGVRVADVSGQFGYGFPTNRANSTIVGTGTISVVESMLVLSTGTDSDGQATIENKRTVRYIPGYDTWAHWTTVFDTPVVDSSQRAGLYTDNDGFFVGYEGTTFYLTRRRDGTDYQTEIDVTALSTSLGYTIDLTKGQVWRLNYGYLGFATVVLEILAPAGHWHAAAKIEYPNTSEDIHITNTFLPPRAEVINTGNTTDITLKIGSFAAGIIDGGGKSPSSRYFHYANSAAFTVGTSETNLFAITNVSTFTSRTNYIPVVLKTLSYASIGTKAYVYRIYKGPTFTGTPTWVNVKTDESVIQYATANIATSALGTKEYTWFTSNVDSNIVPLTDDSLELLPGETIIVTGLTFSAAGDGYVGFRWEEQF